MVSDGATELDKSAKDDVDEEGIYFCVCFMCINFFPCHHCNGFLKHVEADESPSSTKDVEAAETSGKAQELV
jgi:hypothetical protein